MSDPTLRTIDDPPPFPFRSGSDWEETQDALRRLVKSDSAETAEDIRPFRPGSLRHAHGELDQQIKILTEYVSAFESKLDPVLSPELPRNEKDDFDLVTPSSEIAGSVQDAWCRLRMTNIRLGTLLDRIDL